MRRGVPNSSPAPKLVLLAAAACIAGCGFHLQGRVTIPAAMQRTYVEPVDRFSPFYRQVARDLETAGATLVESPEQATAILSILADETGQRVLSVSARNVPTEYEVFYTIEYRLTAATETLLETQELTLTRDYTYDPNLVLGKAHEEQLLREAIVDDLVRIVVKQIATL